MIFLYSDLLGSVCLLETCRILSLYFMGRLKKLEKTLNKDLKRGQMDLGKLSEEHAELYKTINGP